ncbi:MAG: gliding motility-associated C-terminal domain-containing protein [Crocinitomicaceae bacterium]
MLMKLPPLNFTKKLLTAATFMLFSAVSFSQEDCSNGIDDDGDGLIDCLDPDCLASTDCPAFAVPGSCLPIGYYPDITGTEAGFKAANQTADVSIPIPANSERLSLIIQGVYQQGITENLTGTNDVNYGEERVVWGRVEVDLVENTSSGWVEYFVNNHENKRFSWVDEDLGPNMTDTYTTVGHDFAELTDFEMSFDHVGSNFIVGCSRPDVDIAYYTINYGNFNTESLTRIDGANPTQYPVYYDAGQYTQTVDMLAGTDAPDYVILRGIGINQNRYGTNGTLVGTTREETLSIKYIVCNLTTMTASGVLTINAGNQPNFGSTFTFEDYDLTSGQPITTNATLAGDFVGNVTPPGQIAIGDMTIEVVGSQLNITRSNVFGDDYNEMYYVEFLKYSNQPYTSSFFITENAYSSPQDIGFDPGGINNGVGVSGFVDFTIPAGAKRAYLECRANGLYSSTNLVGPTTSAANRTNNNQMYSFTEVNFDLEETTGYYVTLTTSTNQQIYAWQNIPIDPLVDITTQGIYGQPSNTDERINFEIIAPDIFRVHLTNDKLAFERIMQITFLGSKINLVYSSFDQNTTIYTGCDSVYFDMEICNSGGADLAQSVPVSFYDGDPTTDPTAIYLQTDMYDLNIDQGQCETFTFGVDIASLGGATAGDITIVLNDNGSYSGVPGSQIPDTWDIDSLFEQGNPVLECEFNQNIISSPWSLTPPPPPTINFNANTFTICAGEDETIIATPVGTTGEYTMQWTPGGIADTTNTLTVSPLVETWYYLELSDVCHDIIDSVKVEIGDANITAINITDATDCPGQVGFTPGAIDVLPDDPTWTYTLVGGGNTIGPQNNGSFPGLDGQTYLLTVVDAFGCQTDTAVTVGLGANAVTADFILDSLRDVTCFGDANGGAYINNLAGGLQPPFDVTWDHTSGNHATFNNVPVGGTSEQDNLYGGSWVVTVTDQEGCAWSVPFDIDEPDQLTLVFNANNPTCFGFNDGSVTINSTGGNGGNTFVITSANGDQLNAGNSNTANQLVQGWYYATITDSEGCFTEDSIFLQDPGQINVDLDLTMPLCFDYATGVAIADTVYNYTGAYDQISYFWSPTLGNPTGIGADTAVGLTAQDYILTINDQFGCSEVFNFTITQPDEIVFTEIGSDPAFCRLFSYQNGNGVVFVAANGGTGNFTYEWFDIQNEVYSNNSTWGGLNPGDYQIQVFDANGCVLADTVTVDSLNPIADFEATSPQFLTAGVCEGTAVVDVHFVNQSQNFANINNPNADTTFFWNFNEGFPPGWVISHDYFEEFDTSYAIGGTYNVCLVALNKNGCSDTLCKPIVVFDPLTFTTINIFTPNGDGDNDFFTFEEKSQAVVDFSCVIVNRWGIVVHEMSAITDAWDGKDKSGSDCNDGTYFYTYEGSAQNGEEFAGQGTVNIVRGE